MKIHKRQSRSKPKKFKLAPRPNKIVRGVPCTGYNGLEGLLTVITEKVASNVEAALTNEERSLLNNQLEREGKPSLQDALKEILFKGR